MAMYKRFGFNPSPSGQIIYSSRPSWHKPDTIAPKSKNTFRVISFSLILTPPVCFVYMLHFHVKINLIKIHSLFFVLCWLTGCVRDVAASCSVCLALLVSVRLLVLEKHLLPVNKLLPLSSYSLTHTVGHLGYKGRSHCHVPIAYTKTLMSTIPAEKDTQLPPPQSVLF